MSDIFYKIDDLDSALDKLGSVNSLITCMWKYYYGDREINEAAFKVYRDMLQIIEAEVTRLRETIHKIMNEIYATYFENQKILDQLTKTHTGDSL